MKFQRLDAVRGFAAAYVCAVHILPGLFSLGVAKGLFEFGQEAVMVFFVLSGFVISWTFGKAGRRDSFRTYFWKRFLRVYSVWGLALVALFAIASVEAGATTFPSFGQLAGNFFMLQDWSVGKPAVICQPVYGDTPLWSLHYEWWFYMLFPLVMRFRDTTRTHLVGGVAIAASMVYAAVPNPPCRLLMYFSVWWVGAHAACCLQNKSAIKFRDLETPLTYVAVTALPMLVLCFTRYLSHQNMSFGVHPVLEMRHLLSSVGLVSLAFAWRHYRWVGFSKTIGLCSVLAPISYSLYILHYRSVARATYFSFVGSRTLELALYVGLTLLFCCFAELVFYPWLRTRSKNVLSSSTARAVLPTVETTRHKHAT